MSKIKGLFKEFTESESIGGLLLIIATVIALLATNVFIGKGFSNFWNTALFSEHFTIQHFVNDGLMTIFFLLVGLELEREIYVGELSNIKNALLPIFAAIGGMLFPALIHYGFNYNLNTSNGAGIPTATDIAFSLAVLSIFSKKTPVSLKIFLTALAIADDLGAIIVIAIFYTKTIYWYYLLAALGVFGLLLLMNRLRVKSIFMYLSVGVVLWYLLLNSGIHATISGVLVAFAIPFTEKNNISLKIQHHLHRPVALIILPLFALVNTSIPIENDCFQKLTSENSIGIFLGLTLGKPVGIVLFSKLATTFKIAKLPSSLTWRHIIGAGIVAGIGFTMSIFVSNLAFEDVELIKYSQITVLLASITAAIGGIIWFKFVVKK